MEQKFRVEFLEEAKEFLDNLEEKSREKIYYNIWKATQINDNELFKKLKDEIWEFRTLYKKTYLFPYCLCFYKLKLLSFASFCLIINN